jgi:hypothetical protein
MTLFWTLATGVRGGGFLSSLAAVMIKIEQFWNLLPLKNKETKWTLSGGKR